MATFPSNNRIYLSAPEFNGNELTYIENAFWVKQVAEILLGSYYHEVCLLWTRIEYSV